MGLSVAEKGVVSYWSFAPLDSNIAKIYMSIFGLFVCVLDVFFCVCIGVKTFDFMSVGLWILLNVLFFFLVFRFYVPYMLCCRSILGTVII